MKELIYYTKNDKCPVIDFLRTLPKKNQVKILRDLDLLQEYGFELGLPYLKKMQNAEDLWEIRTKFSSNSYRVFFFPMLMEISFSFMVFKRKLTRRLPAKSNWHSAENMTM